MGWKMKNGAKQKGLTIVEVAMEISLTPEIMNVVSERVGFYAAVAAGMSTSVGGIGPLLRERIIAQADEGAQVIGVTLLYDKVWMQRWHAWGQFYLDRVKAGDHLRRVLTQWPDPITLKMADGEKVELTVWEAAYGKARVFFLDDPQIGMIVYPGGFDAPPNTEDPNRWADEMRLRQSWIVGRGALALLKKLKISPDTVILSETPTLFAHNRLVKDDFTGDALFKNTRYIFNDHTPLEYAHPVWPESSLKELKFDPACYKELDTYRRDPQRVDITQLLIDACDGVYGVSKIHGDVMRSMPTLQKYADKIEYITNGVSREIWQPPAYKDFLSMSDDALLAKKDELKNVFINWLWLRFKFDSAWKEDKRTKPIVLWMRRVTGYKRLDILKEIVRNDGLRERLVRTNLCLLVGGRIHQQDAHSDRLVFELLDLIQKHPELENQVIFLDNFNIWEAPNIFSGIDASIMVSDAGKEAAATGFMKAQMNGAMVIATPDGAVPESVIYHDPARKVKGANGFEVKYYHSSPTPDTLLDALEQFRAVYDDPALRARGVRNALAQTPQVSVDRVAKEMITMCERLKKKCDAPHAVKVAQ
ncbi:MAG TPA: glycogen/starch/alpha-glucan phosphorylase [bacterium]|nr:glycogen/starch/alpha-glucan phosphorylase [bacterium]